MYVTRPDEYWPEDTSPNREPKKPALAVEAVAGRYPSRPCIFRPDNIETEIIEVRPGRFILKFGDRAADEMWLQIHLTVGGGD